MTSFALDAYGAIDVEEVTVATRTSLESNEEDRFDRALTERVRQILQLHVEGLSDYQIAKKLRIETPNVYRARKTALGKIDRARTDLSFADSLKRKYLGMSTV